MVWLLVRNEGAVGFTSEPAEKLIRDSGGRGRRVVGVPRNERAVAPARGAGTEVADALPDLHRMRRKHLEDVQTHRTGDCLWPRSGWRSWRCVCGAGVEASSMLQRSRDGSYAALVIGTR